MSDIGVSIKPASALAGLAGIRIYVYVLVILSLLLVDFVPRLYQGDSISYLTTGMNWIPPDRSWFFGYIVNFILRRLHGYEAYILLQAVILAWVVAASRRFFDDFANWQTAYLITAVLVCLDPVLELYVRFFMSDFLPFACFMAVLCGLHAILTAASSRLTVALAFLIICVAGTAAIFLRIAYVPILVLTVLFILAFWFFRLPLSRRLLLGLAAVVPFAAVGLLVLANSALFAERFPHQHFANRISGLLLAAQFSPALQPPDFAAARIPISPQEFSDMQPGDYDRRAAQVFGAESFYLMPFMKRKLGIKDEFDPALDQAAKRLVRSALWRDPFSVAAVYLQSGLIYANPAGWHNAINSEANLSRPLEPWFVDFFNTFALEKISAGITETRSPLIRLYLIECYLYPLQLGLGFVAAGFLLLRARARPAVAVLAGGFLGDLAAAPLYSNYVIARYILAAIFIGYLLIGLAALELLQGRRRHPRSVP